MAGPQVQQRLSGSYNNQGVNGGGINGSGGVGGVGGGSTSGVGSGGGGGGGGGGVRALRQISDQSDVIYHSGGNSGIGGDRVNIGCGPSSSQQGSSNNNLTDNGTNKNRERPSAGCSDALIIPVTQSVDFDLDATKSIKSDDVEQGQRKVRHKNRPLFRRVVNYVRSVFRGSSTTNDSEYEEYEATPRYRPDSLSALSRATRFTEDEIKRIYRGFKAECPTGVVKEETFKIIYSQFFPQGANPTLYAHYVFNTLDQDHSGIVSFEDFVQGLSVLSRGSPEEKLRWTFSLYDINGDGYITKDEMTDIVTAIYELIGRIPDDCPDEEKVRMKVERIFKKMDVNRDGVVTLDEFLECCRNDEAISRSMTVFDTSF